MQSLRYDKKPEKTEKSDAGWMNIGGARAYVDTDGEIEHACPGLEGENITDIINESDASRDRREKKQEAAEAAGWEPERIKDARKVYEDAKQEAPEGHFVVYRKGENYYVFGDEASVLRDLTNTGDGDFAEFKEDAKDHQFERILNGGHKIAIFEEEGQGEEEAELVGTEEPAQEPIPEDAGKPQKEMPKPPGPVGGLIENLAKTRDARKTGSVSTDQVNDRYANKVYDHLQDNMRSGDGFGEVYDLSEETGHEGAIGYHSPAGVLAMFPPHFNDSKWEVRYALPQEEPSQEGAFKQIGPDPSTIDPSEFIKASDWVRQERETYFQDGNLVARSRETPVSGLQIPEVGTWKVDDDFKGNHGRYIEQLQEVDPGSLILPEGDYAEDEKLNPEGRGDDAKQYAEWLKEGKEPPPINVVETEDGGLRVTDGHRRAAAAKMAGQKVKAWISPSVPVPGIKTPDGKPIYTGLTDELAGFTWNEEASQDSDMEPRQEASIDLGTKSDDMASVNVPMSQRGDIDAQLDAHKKREERAARAKQKANAQTRRENKAKAKSLFSDHGEGFIQSVIERKPGTDPREAKKTLDSLVKWEPEKAIEMLEGWASEQEQKEAPALQQDLSQDDDKEEEIPDWLADAGEEEAKEEISSPEKSYESMSREELLAENNRRLPGMEKLNEMESDEELREHLRKDDLHQEQHQRDIDEEDFNMSKESNLKKFRKKHMERFDRQARVFRMEDGPREAIQAKMDQYTSGKHPDGKRMKQWEADNLRREIYNDILEAKGLDRNARMKIQDPPEGSKSKKISPTSKLGRAITDAVGNDPEDREGFADLLHEIYGMKREHIQSYNDALDELIGNFAGDLTGRKRLIGQLQQARDPAHIAAFDEMVEMAENSYPILIQGVGDSEAGLNDPEYALFEAIKSGRKSVPAIHSDEIVGEALSYLDTFDRSGQASQDDPGEDWDHGFYRRRGQKLRNFRGSYHKWMRSKYSRWVKFSSRKQNSQL